MTHFTNEAKERGPPTSIKVKGVSEKIKYILNINNNICMYVIC